MIHFHATRKFSWTIQRFIDSWDPTLASVITSTPYEDLDLTRPVPAGLHVFTDLERLLRPERAYVRRLHDRMARHPESYAVLNDPSRWTGRLGLNQALSAAGINDYRAFRLDQVGPDLRFPAFLRWGNEHTGSLGEPVMSHEELRDRVATHVTGRRRYMRHHLLVIECIDVRSEDGLFRKYSAQKIGDRLFSRHVFFSQQWITKYSDVITEAMVAEEHDYLARFPDAAQIDEVFALAGLDFGRIDYGFADGRLQVWEINTNPVIAKLREKTEPARLPGQETSALGMAARFHELAAHAPTGPSRRLFGPVGRRRWQAQVDATARYDRWRR